MYFYNLIIKRGDLNEDDTRAMVNESLTRHFYPAIGYYIRSMLDNEVVVIVRDESKRGLQVTLGDWFIETNRTLEGEGDEAARRPSGYPAGTLLHYREILPSERLYSAINKESN